MSASAVILDIYLLSVARMKTVKRSYQHLGQLVGCDEVDADCTADNLSFAHTHRSRPLANNLALKFVEPNKERLRVFCLHMALMYHGLQDIEISLSTPPPLRDIAGMRG